jgi:hypothetical protein
MFLKLQRVHSDNLTKVYVGVFRRRQMRALTESADRLLERFGLRFRLARLVTEV